MHYDPAQRLIGTQRIRKKRSPWLAEGSPPGIQELWFGHGRLVEEINPSKLAGHAGFNGAFAVVSLPATRDRIYSG
jgi:hypothetical protein